MVIIVMRILVENLTALSKIRYEVNQHIEHEHTAEMNSKSKIVRY